MSAEGRRSGRFQSEPEKSSKARDGQTIDVKVTDSVQKYDGVGYPVVMHVKEAPFPVLVVTKETTSNVIHHHRQHRDTVDYSC